MPKIKIPKSSPSIDMTPMVDLAFLLVTFFMLSATFRSTEPVEVKVPKSSAEREIPKRKIMVTVDSLGKVFFDFSAPSDSTVRINTLKAMGRKYKVSFTKEQIKKFSFMTAFGCSIKELPSYIEMSSQEQKEFKTQGIPSDSSQNELLDWVIFSNENIMKSAETAFKKEKEDAENKNKPAPKKKDFLPKYILRADSKATYKSVEKVIDVFRERQLCELYFVTMSELNQPKP